MSFCFVLYRVEEEQLAQLFFEPFWRNVNYFIRFGNWLGRLLKYYTLLIFFIKKKAMSRMQRAANRQLTILSLGKTKTEIPLIIMNDDFSNHVWMDKLYNNVLLSFVWVGTPRERFSTLLRNNDSPSASDHGNSDCENEISTWWNTVMTTTTTRREREKKRGSSSTVRENVRLAS